MTPEAQDLMAELNVAYFLSKQLGIRLTVACDIPVEAANAMVRYINRESKAEPLGDPAASPSTHGGRGSNDTTGMGDPGRIGTELAYRVGCLVPVLVVLLIVWAAA